MAKGQGIPNNEVVGIVKHSVDILSCVRNASLILIVFDIISYIIINSRKTLGHVNESEKSSIHKEYRNLFYIHMLFS
jgi:hypothetical protein